MKNKIIDIIKRVRPDIDDVENVEFINQGILDSFDIIAICEAINKTFGIAIKGEDIVPVNFFNLNSLLEMLKKYEVE